MQPEHMQDWLEKPDPWWLNGGLMFFGAVLFAVFCWIGIVVSVLALVRWLG